MTYDLFLRLVRAIRKNMRLADAVRKEIFPGQVTVFDEIAGDLTDVLASLAEGVILNIDETRTFQLIFSNQSDENVAKELFCRSA